MTIEHKSNRVDELEVAAANACAAHGTASERPMRAKLTIAGAIAEKAMMAVQIAGMAAQIASIAGDTVEAVETDDAAMSAALGMSAAMAAAQMAADAVAMAMGAAMGKDPCVPPGTLGTIVVGSPNVLIGGFPMPSWMNIAKGLLKMVKGLKMRRGGRNRGGLG